MLVRREWHQYVRRFAHPPCGALVGTQGCRITDRVALQSHIRVTAVPELSLPAWEVAEKGAGNGRSSGRELLVCVTTICSNARNWLDRLFPDTFQVLAKTSQATMALAAGHGMCEKQEFGEPDTPSGSA